MAATPLTRLAVAVVALLALASCSDDEPEPVAAGGGGIALASTTTEQPRATEPEEEDEPSTTTTKPATTTTTSTTTTTTAPAPLVPSAEEILAVLPDASALGAGEWSREVAPTSGAGAPAPLCDGSTVDTPLAPLLYDSAAADGASARYERPDQSTRARLTVAPMADGEARLAEAQAEIERCAAGADPVNILAWETVGDGSIAYSRTQEGPVGEPPVPGGQTAAWAITRIGPVVVTLNVQSFWADGQQLTPAPTEAELRAFLTAAADAVVGIIVVP